MMYAPPWWYAWLGVVLLFGAISLLKRRGSRLPPMPRRRVLRRPAASDVNWGGDPALSSEDEHAGWDQQVMAAALEEADRAGRYDMALASHEPSFSPGAPVSPFDPGGPAHMDA